VRGREPRGEIGHGLQTERAVLHVDHAVIEPGGFDDPWHASRSKLLEPGAERGPSLAHGSADAVLLHVSPPVGTARREALPKDSWLCRCDNTREAFSYCRGMREEINTHVGHSTPKPRDSCSASQSEPCFVTWEIDDRPSHPLVGSHRGHVTEPMVLVY